MARPRTDIRERILSAALDRFLSDGVDGAALRAVAAAAQTNIGMVYYYFTTKEQLFDEVVEHTYETFLRDLELAVSEAGPLQQRLLRLFQRLNQLSELESKILRLVLREALGSHERFQRIFERFQRGHIALILRVLNEGVAEGIFAREFHPIMLLTALLSLGGPAQLATQIAGKKLEIAGLPTSAQLSELFVKIFLQGVRSTGQRE